MAEPPGTAIFISYENSDAGVAAQIDKTLKILYRDRVRIFFDKKSINPGSKWRQSIASALSSTDVMIALYTGKQSVFVGYEVGVYQSQAKPNPPPVNDTADEENREAEIKISSGSVVLLHDVKTVLPLFSETETVEILTQEELEALEMNEGQWLGTRVGKMLLALSRYNDMYPEPGGQDEKKTYTSDHARAAEAITQAFMEARKTEFLRRSPLQREMQISVSIDPKLPFEGVPDSAPVVASSRTWDLFGIDVQGEPERKLTWGDIRLALLDDARHEGRPSVPWMDKVERDICRLAANRSLGGDDITFVSGQEVWRPIAVSQDILRNGLRRISVQFVPVIERQFPGLPKTSRLLGSVVMASRYHFRYIEGWNEFSKAFSDVVGPEDFVSACQQLLLDLERIEHEGLELGIGDLEALVRAFGEDSRGMLTSVFQVYFGERQKLAAALARVALPLERSIREEAASAIQRFFDATRENNFRFLTKSTELYEQEIQTSMRTLSKIPFELPSQLHRICGAKRT